MIKSMTRQDIISWVAHTDTPAQDSASRAEKDARQIAEQHYDQALRTTKDRFNPDGFMALENQLMGSSKFGRRYILPFGGKASNPAPPEVPFSIDGAASGTVCVVGVYRPQPEPQTK